MKKVLIIIICLLTLFAFTACDSETSSDGNSKSKKANASYEDVDLDLTSMSDTVMYSVVIGMATNPEEYKGKSVRIKGVFEAMYSEEREKILYTCLIQDITACCSQSFEFEPTEELVGSLKGGDEITIVGVLDLYEEDGAVYCTLKNAVVL